MCKWEKKSFLNFSGTIGQKTPVETLPARRWAPAWQKASLRDELPSKRCISVQRFCLAAIASKSTGSAATEVATVSADFGRGGKGETENQRHRFSNLAVTTSAH
jgi:hypothetical protein